MKRVPEVVMQGMEWGYNLAGFYLQPEVRFTFLIVSQALPPPLFFLQIFQRPVLGQMPSLLLLAGK